MLPGVELARRRRVHYHGDGAAGEHYHHHHHHRGGTSAGGVTGPALAARIRLEEKLRGAGPPSPSRWSMLMRDQRDGRAATTSRRRSRQEEQCQHEEQEALSSATTMAAAELGQPPPSSAARAAAELRRTLSKADVCAVCLDEVRERQQRVTRLPCSHRYHSECVLPWLAIQPDCPYCRTLVPQVHTLS